MSLQPATQQRLSQALQQCIDLHATCIRDTHLPIFLRAASEDPESLKSIVGKLFDITNIGDNTVAAIYCIIKLADVNQGMKDLIRQMLPVGFIEYWSADANESAAANARVLNSVLNGEPLGKFLPKKLSPTPTMMTNHVTIHGNVSNSNIAAGQQNHQSIVLEQDFYEILKLLEESGERELAVELESSKADKSKSFEILNGIISNTVKYAPGVIQSAKLLIEKWPF